MIERTQESSVGCTFIHSPSPPPSDKVIVDISLLLGGRVAIDALFNIIISRHIGNQISVVHARRFTMHIIL